MIYPGKSYCVGYEAVGLRPMNVNPCLIVGEIARAMVWDLIPIGSSVIAGTAPLSVPISKYQNDMSSEDRV